MLQNHENRQKIRSSLLYSLVIDIYSHCHGVVRSAESEIAEIYLIFISVLFSMSLFLQWFYRREYKRDMLYNPSPYQTRNPTITGRARVVVPTISEVMRIARNSHVRLWFPRTGRKQRKNKNFRRESYHRVSLPPTIADTGRVNVALTDIPHYES